MAIPTSAVNLSNIFLGTCIPCIKYNASRFNVRYLYFDTILKMYFTKSIKVFAFDPQKICKSGDVALIKELQNKAASDINHEVLEVVYPCGDITDPITGKKSVAGSFRDDIEYENTLYGKVKRSFNYKTAPPRGWQEGKKDFTHRESYLRYHEFEKGDENENQPFSTLP